MEFNTKLIFCFLSLTFLSLCVFFFPFQSTATTTGVLIENDNNEYSEGYTSENEIKEIFDISYYKGKDADPIKHKLNLFLPDKVENPPVLLWIHGGAWAFGGRKYETELARNIAKQGIAVAVISYRLSPGTWRDPKFDKGVQHPEHIKDVARAFSWIYQNTNMINTHFL